MRSVASLLLLLTPLAALAQDKLQILSPRSSRGRCSTASCKTKRKSTSMPARHGSRR